MTALYFTSHSLASIICLSLLFYKLSLKERSALICIINLCFQNLFEHLPHYLYMFLPSVIQPAIYFLNHFTSSNIALINSKVLHT